jgi:hypothetical protein
VRRRPWLAAGASALVHLALVLGLFLLGRRERQASEEPLEIEIVAPEPVPPAALTPEPVPPAPPAPEPAAPAPRAPERGVASRQRASSAPASAGAPARAPAVEAPVAEAPAAADEVTVPADPLATFRPRHPQLALGPKPPPPPPGPRPGTLDALFNRAPDVLHHKTSESLVGVQRSGNGMEARVRPDGQIAFKEPGAKLNGLGASFDVTDMALRAAGQDPYAAQKARIAEATREDRFCLTLKDNEGSKRDALFRLKENLERIARDPSLGAAERRAAVFQLWDGCFDAADDPLARAARATIAAFIRRVFPAGSPEAYTPVELAMLNRRRNCRRFFNPYAVDRGPPDAGADPRP